MVERKFSLKLGSGFASCRNSQGDFMEEDQLWEQARASCWPLLARSGSSFFFKTYSGNKGFRSSYSDALNTTMHMQPELKMRA